tara:strand:- start:118 stop:384 length:267 start_codon:yes stop_codon:yes gene_type:complete
MKVIEAIEKAIDFMETIAPGEVLSLDEFLAEYKGTLTYQELAYGEFLVATINDGYDFNSHEETLVQLIKDHPNDADLGKAVRDLYNRI